MCAGLSSTPATSYHRQLIAAITALASHNHAHVTISLRESTILVYHYQQVTTTTLIPRGLFDSGLTNLLLGKVLTSRLMIARGGYVALRRGVNQAGAWVNCEKFVMIIEPLFSPWMLTMETDGRIFRLSTAAWASRPPRWPRRLDGESWPDRFARRMVPRLVYRGDIPRLAIMRVGNNSLRNIHHA